MKKTIEIPRKVYIYGLIVAVILSGILLRFVMNYRFSDLYESDLFGVATVLLGALFIICSGPIAWIRRKKP